MRTVLLGCVTGVLFLAATAVAQQSPPSQASVTLGGKKVSINYGAPSVRGRKIFGDGGRLSKDPTYPAWRAGADSATAFHSDADLNVGGLNVPKGDYTLYVWVKNPDAWELIINKETGQWGTEYTPGKDLGRVKMTMSKPPSPVERMKYTLTATSLELAWENHVASVPLAAK